LADGQEVRGWWLTGGQVISWWTGRWSVSRYCSCLVDRSLISREVAGWRIVS
jgi:hypothetical protein